MLKCVYDLLDFQHCAVQYHHACSQLVRWFYWWILSPGSLHLLCVLNLLRDPFAILISCGTACWRSVQRLVNLLVSSQLTPSHTHHLVDTSHHVLPSRKRLHSSRTPQRVVCNAKTRSSVPSASESSRLWLMGSELSTNFSSNTLHRSPSESWQQWFWRHKFQGQTQASRENRISSFSMHLPTVLIFGCSTSTVTVETSSGRTPCLSVKASDSNSFYTAERRRQRRSPGSSLF